MTGQQGAILPGFPQNPRMNDTGSRMWQSWLRSVRRTGLGFCLDLSNQSIGFNRLIATRRESLWLRYVEVLHQPVAYPIYQIWGVFNQPCQSISGGAFFFPGWAKHLVLVFFDPWRIWSIFLKTMWWFLGTATRSFNLCASPRSWRSVSWKIGSRLKKWLNHGWQLYHLPW